MNQMIDLERKEPQTCHDKSRSYFKLFTVISPYEKGHNSWVIVYAFCHLLIFFSKSTFLKVSFSNTIRVSSSLKFDPDQAQHCGVPDLGPNCLQKVSAATSLEGNE